MERGLQNGTHCENLMLLFQIERRQKEPTLIKHLACTENLKYVMQFNFQKSKRPIWGLRFPELWTLTLDHRHENQVGNLKNI